MKPSTEKDQELSILQDLSPNSTFSIGRLPKEQLRELQEAEASLMVSRWELSDSEEDLLTLTSDMDEVGLSKETREKQNKAAFYQIQNFIGRGGCGEVWSALQSSLGRVIAVKRLPDEYFNNNQELHFEQEHRLFSFKQEALTTAYLEHPNIVPVYDLGVDDSTRPVLAMKLVRGKPWHELIHADFHSMTSVDFLAKHLPILIDVAQAVGFAHSRGFVHRDIKPSQVMVGDYGEVALMDWGLAAVFDPEAVVDGYGRVIAPKIAPSLKNASSPSGTPAFMAPEQTLDTAIRVGPWTDIFLLGGTLYVLLTGTSPYRGPGAKMAFEQAKVGEVEPPHIRAPGRDIPPDLVQLCNKAMNKDIQERLLYVNEFVQAIKDYLSGAGNRRKSTQLTDQAESLIDDARGDYKLLSFCDDHLVHALGLWHENPEIGPLRERVSEEYARAAITHGDLELARVQIDHLKDEEARQELHGKIKAVESRRRRIRWQRTFFTAASAFLFPALIVGILMYKKEWDLKHAANAKRLGQEQKAKITQKRMLKGQKVLDQLYGLHDQYAKEASVAQTLSQLLPLPTTLNTPLRSRKIENQG